MRKGYAIRACLCNSTVPSGLIRELARIFLRMTMLGLRTIASVNSCARLCELTQFRLSLYFPCASSVHRLVWRLAHEPEAACLYAARITVAQRIYPLQFSLLSEQQRVLLCRYCCMEEYGRRLYVSRHAERR